ncbi:hypothetical protein [Mycoplasma suis]|nr:hypothetical protein [Mycoplasma suis]
MSYLLAPIVLGASSLPFLISSTGNSNNNISSLFSNLFVNRGGGHNTRNLEFEKRSKRYLTNSMGYSKSSQLELKNLSSSHQNDNIEVLFSGGEQNLNFFDESEISGISNSDSTIGTMFKELSKNQKTKKIETESSSSLEEVKKILVEHSENFENIRKNIEKWEKKNKEISSESTLSRGRRQVPEEEISPPSPKERKALFCFYKKFSELSQKQKGFSSQLKNVEKGINSEDPKFQPLTSENNVLKALEEIGWKEDGDMPHFGEYLRGEKKGAQLDDPISWLLDGEFLSKIRGQAVLWKNKTEDFLRGQEEQWRKGWSWRRPDPATLASSLKIFQGQTGNIEKEALLLIAAKLTGEMLKASGEK